MRKIIFSLLFLSILSSFAQNELLVLGADPLQVGPFTPFDQQLDLMVQMSKKRTNLHSSFLFTQGHKVTDDILKNSSTKNFTNATLTEELNQLKKRMQEMKEGQTVSVVILAHGQRASFSRATLTHDISAHKDDQHLHEKDGFISLDFLKDLAEIAAQKKLKLAIVDGSCYSGETLKIAQIPGLEKTCIISASTDHATSNARVTLQLLKGLVDGPNLQSGYITGRKASREALRYFSGISVSTAPAFPQISDSIGTFLSKEFFPKLFRYLRAPSSFTREGFDSYLQKDMETFLNANFSAKKISEAQVPCSKESCLSTENEFKKMSQFLTQLVLNIDMSSLHSATKKYMDQVQVYDQLIKKVSQDDISAAGTDLFAAQLKLMELAGLVAAEERKVYELVYNSIQAKIDKGEIQALSSPCRDITW
jgi:hypothetical protein